jgi:electron-transferring-flavoprotein dehydrogenase
MEIDVLFVGAGVANLSAAYRLKKNLDAYNAKAKAEGKKPIEEPTIMVIEKGHEIGSDTLSGAVIDPVAFRELFPETDIKELPFICPVREENVYYLLPWMKLPIPGLFLPAEMHNGG